MIHVLTVDVTPLLDEDLFKSKLSLLSSVRQEKALAYRFPKGRALSLGVGLLCDDYLSRLNCCEKDSGFSYDEFGKPYFARLPQIKFSLSHSKNMAAAAFSDAGEVGVDVEKIKPVTSKELNVAKRCFSEAENSALLALSGAEQDLLFFRLWTEKESLFKYNSSLTPNPFPQGLPRYVEGEGSVSVFHFFHLDDFALTVCAGENDIVNLESIDFLSTFARIIEIK
ncbi:MAG: 4'-phosphopantetheinyl transferase superfamily protein [Candidatus Symbiothrix sp.]|jgi:4'-phosphopantetheinyl transferase|nr:4'-phosphopantetheinyl transferase superfamily protein [Candidatus Symbiothrix sp.]